MWNTHQTQATLARPLASLKIDAAQPEAGVHLDLLGVTTTLWPIAVLQDCPLVECYARGDDFVATYEAGAAFPFRTQLYWTVLRESSNTLALQLTISVQTDLLDTHPVVRVGTATADWPTTCEATPHGTLTLLRPVACESTIALGVHPTDHVAADHDTGAGWPLFAHFLEKGVIRRARLLAVVVPREGDLYHAAQSLSEFAAAEPPLTV